MSDVSNVRSAGYFIARTQTWCRSCGGPIEVLALAVPPRHETADEDREAGGWYASDTPALLFFVSWLPDRVLQRLSSYSTAYRLSSNEGSSGLYWANYCGHCGEMQSDEELHCEPGAFVRFSAAEAEKIQIIYVRDAFEAAAAGYASDPEFLAWPSTSSI